jgi:superfamily I DNA/RNA helicase
VVGAGPGSGKTRVWWSALRARGAGHFAGRILAITFTEKAANEIKQRLVEHFTTTTRARAGDRARLRFHHPQFLRAAAKGKRRGRGFLDPGFTIQEDAVGAIDAFQAAEETLTPCSKRSRTS